MISIIQVGNSDNVIIPRKIMIFEDFSFNLIQKSVFPVYKGTNDKTNEEIIMKSFGNNSKKFEREKLITQDINHPALLKSLECDTTSNKLYLEFAHYGDLTALLMKAKGGFGEIISKYIFLEILCATSCLHENGFAHLDLKTDNVLLDRHLQVKVSDFDQCQKFDEGLESKGSPCWRAPELTMGKCTDYAKADVFSLGVILFVLVTRTFPFYEQDGKYDNFYFILQANPARFWQKKTSDHHAINGDLKNLIESMLKVDPAKRPCINEIKSHPWLKNLPNHEEYIKDLRDFLVKLGFEEK